MNHSLGSRALFLFFAIAPIAVAAPECRDDLRDADNYTVSSVTVEGRFVPPLDLPIKAGDKFSNTKVQAAMDAVAQAIRSAPNEQIELQNLGSAGVLYVTRCLLVEDRRVSVVIQPRYLRVDLLRVGSNILPVPRSILPTFYTQVPAPLRALHPVVGIYFDEKFGFAPSAEISGNAFALGDATQLDFAATGRKSLEHSFYETNDALSLARQKFGEEIERLALDLSYSGKEVPLGDETFSRQAFRAGLSAKIKTHFEPVRTIFVGADFRLADDRFERRDTSENAGALRVLAEGRAGGGLLRAATWFEAAAPERMSNYQRVAGLLAYEKEFLVAPNQSVGLEAVAGGGRSWNAPSYARFYGGNTDRNFLYDPLDSAAMNAFPVGPWIRSFGEGQAVASRAKGREGARAYWNLNLNLTLPIPGWSAPLVPNEEIADGVTLKRLLKNKAGDSVSFYAVELESEGMSPEAALAKAEATYGEVKPAVEFIADRANVYSVKPLLLCDVAGLDGETRVALGGGMQLTIVTAKFELGYMATAVGERGDSSGNFFARIVFENLF